MNRILTIWALGTMVLVATTVSGAGADEVFSVTHREAIAVRVLDGKDGKPQAHAHVMLAGGYDKRDLGLGLWREEALTDSNGMVRLSNALTNLPLIRVRVLTRHGCEPDSDQAAFSLERIRRDGLSTANRCGTAVATDAPGVFTVFVKPAKTSARSEAKDAYSMPLAYPMRP
jgi:hypothetical protein